ncbi:LysR family transcriptional regulator [Cohaesibacter celericrescens]|uniref:LysR family transcriptional regulator n=1 Tax=Cohaesibacter celericrescens TaxID=2067669 RepID=A0A2N5XRA5_9HYPH|nr:LysR family transcriptional regulator [Cohaesibacter celericrescens]PLW77041.1 LysR family transcriptional regulator [Cohaesibacter celericrescens]
MKIRNLDTFYWVATLGSFRAAANYLNLTQPAVSARIQILEQDLGIDVFQRNIRNAMLTHSGRKLLPYAEKLMMLDQQILKTFADTTQIVQTIRLGAAETIACSWLPDFLNYVGRTTPGITFELSVDTTNNLRNALLAREIDLAFLMGPVSEASISNQPICGYEMIFAAISSIATKKKYWTISDIASHRLLTFSRSSRPGKEIQTLLSASYEGPLNLNTSTSIGALRELACAGFGICALPKAIINEELKSGALKELKTDIILRDLSFTASYVEGSATSGLVKAITTYLNDYLEA